MRCAAFATMAALVVATQGKLQFYKKVLLDAGAPLQMSTIVIAAVGDWQSLHHMFIIQLGSTRRLNLQVT